MKNVLLAVLALALPMQALATKGPFEPAYDKRFKALENDVAAGPAIARKMARFQYDVAVDGGSSTVHSSGVIIPAGAVITDVLVYINTAFTDSGAGSVRINCANNGDIMAYKDLTAYSINSLFYGGISPSSPAGSAMISAGAANVSGATSITSACTLKTEVRSDAGYVPQTAGKMTVVVEYFNKN